MSQTFRHTIYIRESHRPQEWRRDYLRNPIKHDDYGDRKSVYGWEIDHIVPVRDGGGNDLSNLRSLQWRVNANRN